MIQLMVESYSVVTDCDLQITLSVECELLNNDGYNSIAISYVIDKWQKNYKQSVMDPGWDKEMYLPPSRPMNQLETLMSYFVV